MHFPPHTLGIGRHVRARGRVWRVDGTEHGTQGIWVTLQAADGAGPVESCALIWPHDPLPSAAEPRPRRTPRRRAARLVLAALADDRRCHDVWCAAEADIDVHPWQLAPVAAVLRGATRVLLADAVGLGKTIEASVIVAELRARRVMRRALVLAPVALAQAWLDTLRHRFHLEAALVMAHELQRWQHRPAAAGHPWRQAPVIVASIDLAKQPTAWASLEAVGFDVLVVDEAHHATPATDRGALVAQLAARTPWVVLCSATPHTGDPSQFEALCRLGDTGTAAEAPMLIFRRTRSVMAVAAPKRTLTVLRVRLEDAEWQLHSQLEAYLNALRLGPAHGEAGLQLLCTVLSRRLASSPDALRHTLQRRLASLDDQPAAGAPAQPSLFAALDPEHDEDDCAEPWSGRAGLDSRADERQHLVHLCALTERTGGGAKRRALQRLLRRTREPMVVFSEYRATVLATARACAPHASVAVLHGGLSPDIRAHVLDTFLRGTARVLMTTDVAGEGLNLQHRARLVVTLDWPWRPHRLEQRIGRVDRLGQQRRVHALVLSARTPTDEIMRSTLQRHSDAADADLVARATTTVTDRTCASLAARVHQQRRWHDLGLARTECRGLSGAWVRPRVPHPRQVMVVGVVRRLSADGHVMAQQVVGLEVTLRADAGSRPPWARIVRQIANDPRIHEACRLAADAEPRVRHGEAKGRALTEGDTEGHGAAARIARIRDRLRQSPTGGMQPSMFDRRAEAHAAAAVRARSALDAHLAATAHILDDIQSLPTPEGPRDAVSVIAVLPASRVVRA